MNEAKIVEEAVMGDPDALEFLRAMARALHFWDDLIDKDVNLTDDAINSAMWDALVRIPRNPFYRQNVAEISPVLIQSIINWRIATKIERDPAPTHRDLGWAFVIRSTYVDLVTVSAAIVGGVEHAVACGPAIRRWAHGEGFAVYLDNLATEIRTRNGDHHVLS